MINADTKIRLIRNSRDGKRYAIYPDGDSIRISYAQGLDSNFASGVHKISFSNGYVPTVIVTNQTELNTELSKTAAELSGKVIGVQYNATPYIITRSSTPNLKGKDFGVAGLVICGYGATMPIFSSLDFQGTKNLTLDGIEVYRNTNGTLITIRSACSNMIFSNMKIHGDYYNPNGTYTAYQPAATQASAFTTVSAGAGEAITNIYIYDCEIYDILEVLTTSKLISGDFHFIGNNCHTFYTGALNFNSSGGGGTTKINWNTFYEPYGLATDVGTAPPHIDFIQPRAVATDWILEIIGNVMFPGNARCQDPQCIFMDDQHIVGDATHFYTATVKGNVCVTNAGRTLAVVQAKNSTVIGNTVIHANNTATVGARIDIGTGTGSYPNGNGGGNVAKNNVCHTLNGTLTESNNSEYGAYTTAALEARFDGPAFTGLYTKANVLDALNMLTGGLLDQTIDIGAIGSGYVDYNARTINEAME